MAQNLPANTRDASLTPGVRKISWRGKRQPTPGFLEESHEQRSLGATVHGVTKSRTRTEHAHMYIKMTRCQAYMDTHM